MPRWVERTDPSALVCRKRAEVSAFHRQGGPAGAGPSSGWSQSKRSAHCLMGHTPVLYPIARMGGNE